jgi:hypothetical protein
VWVTTRATFFAISVFATGVLSGCIGSSTGNAPIDPAAASRSGPVRARVDDGELKGPALIAFDNQSSTLEYWPIQQGGGQNPTAITSALGIVTASGMAADRGFLAIASFSPSMMVTYNVRTQVELTYPDAAGPPIDLAMAKGDTVYALNASSVTAYPLDRSAPRMITCPYITQGVAIATDDQSNVYVNGYGPSFMGVVEFPTSTWTCTPLNLKPENGVIGGIAVDPVTDDLIVIDNPGSCRGSTDGRMTIYTRPYLPKNGTQVNLNATYCAGIARLDANSQNMFLMDSNGTAAQVDELTYPGAQSEGVYGGAVPGGFTTMPNALPN